MTYARELVLPYDQNAFSLTLSALSYSHPATNRYRYKLDGLDHDWNEVGSGRRVATYTTLPPGIYTFSAQGATSRGAWSEPVALHIEILPPWWGTWWFKTVCATLALVAIWLFHSPRIRNIEKREREFRKLAENCPDIVMRFDPNLRVSYVNPIIEEYAGLRPNQLLRKTSKEAGVFSRDVQMWEAALWQVLSTGRATTKEFTFRTPKGEREFDSRFVPEVEDAGSTRSVLAIIRDITERRRAEQDRDELRSEVAHINRINTLGEFSASLSHELKQPLSAVIINAEACLGWLRRSPPDIDEACEAVTNITKDGYRTTKIIDRLRSLYKRDVQAERQSTDVNEIILDILNLLRSEADRHAIRISTSLATAIPKVSADRVQLQQVLMNLMLNGIEAMRATGGELTIASQDRNCEVLITIADLGVGLPTENVDQIFAAFFTTKPQGSGMGLAISRSIIEAHCGRLWATANAGRGATFLFTLPHASPQGGFEIAAEPGAVTPSSLRTPPS
jgi:PAS domain S-box-containing protein